MRRCTCSVRTGGAWRMSSPRTHKSDAGEGGKFSVERAGGRPLLRDRRGSRGIPSGPEPGGSVLRAAEQGSDGVRHRRRRAADAGAAALGAGRSERRRGRSSSPCSAPCFRRDRRAISRCDATSPRWERFRSPGASRRRRALRSREPADRARDGPPHGEPFLGTKPASCRTD